VVLEPFCGRRRPGRPVSSSLAVLQDGGLVACGAEAQQKAAAWRPTFSFSGSWHGEAFHGLGIQGVKVSDLPGALPQPSVSPASLQGP
jgi:hypothetical protein